jgi:hypothetical protein
MPSYDIREVWAHNLEEEMENTRQTLGWIPYVNTFTTTRSAPDFFDKQGSNRNRGEVSNGNGSSLGGADEDDFQNSV